MRTGRTVIAGLVLGLAAMAGCSDGGSDDGGGADGSGPGSDEAPGGDEVTLAFIGDVEPSDADLEQAVAVVERRIEALDVDATVTGDRGKVVVTLADDDPAVAAEVTSAVEAQGELRFRPVLATDPTGEVPVTPVGEEVADAEVRFADDAGVVYTMGPAGATGEVVESAEARLGQTGQWEVFLTLHPGEDGIDAFNRLAAACHAGDGTCATSQVAIVLDSVVQSAPTIQQPSFERDQIVISGAFDPAAARELAAVLEAGALPYALTLAP